MTDRLNSSDTIFHFTTKTTGLEYILDSMKLKLNRYSKTNDPHEYRQRNTTAVLDGSRYNTNTADIIHSCYYETVQNTKIACFCRNVVRRKFFYPAYQKNRMWSQYGDNHEGLCLVFSKKKLLNDLRAQYEGLYAGDVEYFREEGKFRKSEIFTEDPLLNNNQKKYVKKHITRYRDEIFMMKHIDYRDEDEFRILLIDDNDEDVFCDISGSITAVIAGDRFPEVYTAMVRNLCREKSLDYYKYMFRDFRPSLFSL